MGNRVECWTHRAGCIRVSHSGTVTLFQEIPQDQG